jgi:protein-disulfide isomerase
MKYIQRFILTLAVILLAGLGADARAQAASAGADPRLQDMVIGKADAKITIIEYASLTCPHCAAFHADILPAVKADYIDTGKAKLVFRDFPLDNLAFAGAILARCGGPDRYFTFLNVLFAQQRQWATASDPKAALTQIARLGGVSAEQFDACLADKALGDYILNSRLEGNQKFNVNSTPTLIINGKTEAGVPSLDELRKKLDALAK